MRVITDMRWMVDEQGEYHLEQCVEDATIETVGTGSRRDSFITSYHPTWQRVRTGERNRFEDSNRTDGVTPHVEEGNPYGYTWATNRPRATVHMTVDEARSLAETPIQNPYEPVVDWSDGIAVNDGTTYAVDFSSDTVQQVDAQEMALREMDRHQAIIDAAILSGHIPTEATIGEAIYSGYSEDDVRAYVEASEASR